MPQEKQMTGTMAGKVALVTGGSSGIGRAAALAFAAAGASVVVASRGEASGQAVEQLIREGGGQCTWVQCDVSQGAQVEQLIAETVRLYGRLDCAFNNGGSGGRGGWTHEIAEEDWDQTVDGFLKSVWLCMKFELGYMLEHGGGAIVNNSSVDGLRAFPIDPVYSAAKHGVIGLTKSAAVQYARRGIRINAVCPGWILTPPVQELLQSDPNSEQMMLSHQPIGRLGAPEEVAQAVLWLCSDQASLVTGTALPVDGAYTAV
jgi:NAD(P)-dependent dehydrogenase (short-subunit alcohol dehydrogenase family)